MLLAPIFSYDNDTKQWSVTMEVTEKYTPDELLDLYYSKEEWARYIKYAENHPFRIGRYQLRVIAFKAKANTTILYYDVDYAFLEWVRSISNVSATFRRELGDVIWARTSISDSYVCSLSPMHIDNFLHNRRAGLPGLKEISLTLDITLISGKLHGYNKAKLCLAFERLCETLESHRKRLTLDTLSIYLFLDQNDLEASISGMGEFASLAASKKLSTTKEFELDFILIPSVEWKKSFGDDDERRVAAISAMESEWVSFSSYNPPA
jgi:hypothetical protein